MFFDDKKEEGVTDKYESVDVGMMMKKHGLSASELTAIYRQSKAPKKPLYESDAGFPTGSSVLEIFDKLVRSRSFLLIQTSRATLTSYSGHQIYPRNQYPKGIHRKG
jgi:hypothetical protein